jgi:DNA-binding SARP family transcriptional activator
MNQLRLALLGIPTITIGDTPALPKSNTKAQALLYYLATTRRMHYRAELASLFWPDMPDAQALKNLRNILPVLRAHLGEHIHITRQTVSFNRQIPYWLDVEVFEALLNEHSARADTAMLWDAVTLYYSDFLSGFYVRNAPLFEEWMLRSRERLRDMLIDALQTLATRHLQQHDHQAALNATRRLLQLAPWHETGHQQQMQALLGMGQRSAALAQYQLCCQVLAVEFNVMPSAETTRIYEQIKAISHVAALPAAAQPLAVASMPLAMSTDGTQLAVPDTRTGIRLEHLKYRRRVYWLSGHSEAVTGLSFSPDGRTLASASADQTIRLWDTASGQHRATLTGHSGTVMGLSFSPDGRTLASASADQTVRLWDTTSGTLHRSLKGHEYPVVHVAFLPDGTRLVSIDTHCVVRFWDLIAYHPIDVQTLSLSC